jgi:hypothetical protein
MRKLSSSIIALIFAVSLYSQTSPHGEVLVTNCTDCHKTSGWKVDEASINFNHSGTKFPLVGQHKAVACKACHKSLEFSKTQTDCYVCHNDMHQQTLGNDCGRCHTPNSWLVTNITQLHQQSRFPLIGPHITADCKACHTNLGTSIPSSSLLRFDQLGVECYDCHKANYSATTAPNHAQSNYSTNCTDCHNINSFSWSGAGINHNFFPLEGGHDISDCNKCHTSGTFSKIPSECVSCHQSDYNGTNNPNHTTLNFSTVCNECHSLNPGWKPAEYRNHDATSFPIYSGTHNGEWNSCSDCHTNPSNYAIYTCTSTCHPQTEMNDSHSGVSGYEYISESCFACHPSGSAEGAFDHNKSAFPLTGAHTTTDCASCHTSGYAGTSNVCASCHTTNYNQTTNPNHTTTNISNDCAACHTTNPGWNPATFATHNNYYVLEGAHAPIANECATCHNGNYNNTPNTCAGCHMSDYNKTTDPNHAVAQFPTACETCHTQTAWTPSTFNHDGLYFPIYSGKHRNQWNTCAECHTNPSNFTVFTCTTSCHPQSTTNSNHQEVSGYSYNSNACYSCHPNGSSNKKAYKGVIRENFK